MTTEDAVFHAKFNPLIKPFLVIGQASDMHLTGIIDAQEFRDKIVAAREAMKSQRPGAPAPAAAAQLAALHAIESRLAEIAGLLRQR